VQLSANAMPNKLANNRKSMRLNMLLNGAGHVSDSVAHSGLRNTFLQRSLRHFDQECDLRRYGPDGNGDGCVTIKSFVARTKIQRNNVALAKDFFLRRDAMHDLFVHRCAQTRRKTFISLECGLCAMIAAVLLRQSIQLKRRDPFSDPRLQQPENTGDNLIRLEEQLDFFRRL